MKFFKKLLNRLFSRVVLVSVGIALQLAFWLVLYLYLTFISAPLYIIFTAIGLIIVLFILNQRINPSYKILWAILMVASPVFGVAIYFFGGRSSIRPRMRRKFEELQVNNRYLLEEDETLRDKIQLQDLNAAHQSSYIRDYGGYPLQVHTKCRYYTSGEEMYEPFLKSLQDAKHYIFLEFFIIDQGEFWDELRELLIEKAEEGLDVRLIFDDMGCITRMPWHFYKELQEKGVQCAAFNPYRPIINIVFNNRDHRKICVVDGYIAYTGGVNLADEYVNFKQPFGYWKDTAISLEGEAVWNLTEMFLEMWSFVSGVSVHFEDYLPHVYHPDPFMGEGYVQPYCDTPLDHEMIGENVYMNMIHEAREYLYICTPYLIIDNEMMTSLCLAAKSGVDVKIITPGIPDKKMIFMVTESYFEQLIESGVEIYKFKPGFIHSKSFVCDDRYATIGTINLDYRSLYLHFENGVWLYDHPVIQYMKEDFLDTLGQCHLVTLNDCLNRSIFLRGFESILRLVGPLI